MNDTRMLFDRVLADEPALTLTLEPVVTAGRRVRRRRRIAYGAGTASVAAVALVAVGPLLRTGADVHQLTPVASATPGQQYAGLTAEQRAIAEAIVAASPAGWTFDFAPGRWDGTTLETTVDDGSGAGRLSVGVGGPGTFTQSCENEPSEPVQCATKPAEGEAGAGVIVRTSTGDNGDIEGRQVEYIAADGSGAVIQDGAYVLPWPLPAFEAGPDATPLTFKRGKPAYTREQAVQVVRAVDAAYRKVHD